MISEICIDFHVIYEPTASVGINFHFFGDFSVIKLVKTCLFDALADGGLRTNHRDSEPGGPRINVCSFLLTSFVFSLHSHLHSLSLFILASSLLGDLVHHLASVRIIKLSSVCRTSTRCCKNKHYLDTSLCNKVSKYM